jgi:S1-C subfamily serine protease
MNYLKIKRCLIIFSLLLIAGITAKGQSLGGVWTGKIWQEPETEASANCVYSIKLEPTGTNFTGQAVIECIDPLAGKVMGQFEITLTVASDGLYYKDLYVTKSTHPVSGAWCIKEGRLYYDKRTNRIFGPTQGYSMSYGFRSPCRTISFNLSRQPDESKPERPTRPSDKNAWAGNGTGVVIDPKGIVATNYHVVQDATEIEIDFGIGDRKRSYKCEILATDKKNDLALLRISDSRFHGFGLLPFTFQTTVARVGETVFALGFPMALSVLGTEIKYTRGDISALSGVEGDPTTYTLSLSIQPGNSGGPLFDRNGNLIGITNAKIVSPDVDNVAYAIKSVYLKSFIELISYRVDLPTGSSLAGKAVTDQISVLSEYVGLIKIR